MVVSYTTASATKFLEYLDTSGHIGITPIPHTAKNHNLSEEMFCL